MTDKQVYIQCMTKVRQRIAVIRWLLKDDPLGSNRSMLTTELLFIQFRKILELIAFASLTANKDKYAAEHKKLEYEWSATKVLKRLRQVNSNFYPVPLLKQPGQKSGQVLLVQRKDGYLTESDFERLYDASADVLHMRNPFKPGKPFRPIEFSEAIYADRIQRLVSRHLIRLVDQDTFWIVTVPGGGGEIQMAKATSQVGEKRGERL